MTLRAKDRASQWLAWLGAALVAVVAYVVLARLSCGSASLDLLDPCKYRIALPLAMAFAVFAWETRWDGVIREKDEDARSEGETVKSGEIEAKEKGGVEPLKDSPSQSTPTSRTSPLPGEAEYVQARAMPHRQVPDFKHDGKYLTLLVKSAELGYSRAFVKLGEYAMRRKAWVEAYYWTWRARRGGIANLDNTLRKIRRNWTLSGSPRESWNVYELFPKKAGSIGRALLNIDSGRDASAARKYLKFHHPEYLGRSQRYF